MMRPDPKKDEAAFAKAERLKAAIFARTGILSQNLQCPREKSAMTPCIARDGKLAVGFGIGGVASCVGCERGVNLLLEQELAKRG